MEAEQQSVVKGAGGSRFAAACSMMRLFMKEQGGGVTMDLMPGAEGVAVEERIRKTMELFPQRAGTLKENSHESRILEPERAQLSIFYGGRTVVFDDFPADKANELMKLAGSFNAPAASDKDTTYGQPFLADMPVARKASLQRFLEKRKSRLAAADPYQLPLGAPAARAAKETGKPAEHRGAPWLGFNSELDLN